MHVTPVHQQRKELVLFDESNPRAIINLVPDPVKKEMRILWESSQKNWLCYTEKVLRRELYNKGKTPEPVDNQIRIRFWLEYDYVQSEPRIIPMNMSKVIAHLISKEAFYTTYISNRAKLAWMLCPPMDYETNLQETLNLSIDKMRHFIENIKLIDDKGQTNVAVLREFKAIEQILYNRAQALLGGTKAGGRKQAAKPEKEIPADAPAPPGPVAPDPNKILEDERAARRARIAELQKQKAEQK